MSRHPLLPAPRPLLATTLALAMALAPAAARADDALAQAAPPAARAVDDPGLGTPAPPTPPPPPPAYLPPPPAAPTSRPVEEAPRFRTVVREERLTGLMTAGIAVFGSTYLLTALFGGYVYDNGGFYVPVIGPVLYRIPDDQRGNQLLAVFSTLAQASGVAMALTGGLVKRKVTVREPVTQLPTIIPTVTPGGAGLAVGGRF